jgi:hypothetical protein
MNLSEIYQKICLYEDTVKTTVEVVSQRGVGNEVLGMVSSALNKIEKLNPRQANGTHQQS